MIKFVCRSNRSRSKPASVFPKISGGRSPTRRPAPSGTSALGSLLALLGLLIRVGHRLLAGAGGFWLLELVKKPFKIIRQGRTAMS